MISLYTIVFLFLIAVIAPYLATDKPWYVRYKGESFFPAFTTKQSYVLKDEATGETEKLSVSQTEWRSLKAERIIWAPVPYAPGKSDLLNFGHKSPGGKQFMRDASGNRMEISVRFRHWLGTGAKGEDVLAGMIHGARISLTIGLLSMLIASVLGLALGAAAGYYGDDRLFFRRGTVWLAIPGIFFAWFYAFTVRSYILTDALAASTVYFLFHLLVSLTIFALIMMIFCLLSFPLNRFRYFSERISIPVDLFVSRMIEIMISLPKIIFIITIAAIAKRSILNVILIIGFTSWTGIARLVRAEMLRIRNLDYIAAARVSGLKDHRIIFRHALPNALAPALVSIAFGVASAILAESSLSFLNIGVPEDTVTWGALLNEGRTNIKAWWLILFPGLAIFLTVTVYNLLGEGLRDALDPRLK